MSNSTLEVVNLVPVAKACRKCGLMFSGKLCIPCSNAYHALYRAKNSEKLKAYRAKYAIDNAEKIKANYAKYVLENAEKIRERKRVWMVNNPEKAKAMADKWRAKNPNAHRIYTQNRRALKAKSGGRVSQGLKSKLFSLQKGKCPCCAQPLGDDYHLDHIMPLALGVSNTDDNIQLLRASCNLSKHADHPIDFMQSRGFLL